MAIGGQRDELHAAGGDVDASRRSDFLQRQRSRYADRRRVVTRTPI
jgi:hypothetical protein